MVCPLLALMYHRCTDIRYTLCGLYFDIVEVHPCEIYTLWPLLDVVKVQQCEIYMPFDHKCTDIRYMWCGIHFDLVQVYCCEKYMGWPLLWHSFTSG